MKKLSILITLALLPMYSVAQNASDMLEKAIASTVSVAVYNIEETHKTLGYRGSPGVAYERNIDLSDARSTGSGFVIKRNGKFYVITNAHVVDRASSEAGSIYVYSVTRRKYEMKMIGGDSFYDLALLEFVTPPGNEVEATDFRKEDARIGERVYAIGNPLREYPFTITDGIISAKNRVRGGLTGKFGFLQTTATVIWGNSGGPLVDEKGNVIGVNTKIAFAERGGQTIWQPQINFAIEAPLVQRIVGDILDNNGFVKRAFIGVEIKQGYRYNATNAFFYGNAWEQVDSVPIIGSVIPNTPAANSGLTSKIGARIMEINGVPVRNIEEALGELEKAEPNSNVIFTIARGNSSEKITIKSVELNPRNLERIATYVITKDADKELSVEGDDVFVVLKEKDYWSGETVGIKYKLSSAGLNEEDFKQMWRIEKLSDLGAALRMAGITGVIDLELKDVEGYEEPKIDRLNLAGHRDARHNTLWY